MTELVHIIADVIDWRFTIGLIFGFLLTLIYVVLGLFFPLIRELKEFIRAEDDKST